VIESQHASEVERLRHAISVYRAAIEAPGHRQSKDFHRAVANDAEWTLAQATGTPCPAVVTHSRKSTLNAAIKEVYSELVIVCLDASGGRRSTPARRHAAALLGLPYAEFAKWYRQ